MISNPQETLEIPPARYATLKFDDLMPQEGGGGVSQVEQQVYEMLMAQGIPHAWGVCRLGLFEDPEFYDWLKARDAEGIEIWHHGNHHDRIPGDSWEFRHRDADSQRRNIRFTQERVRERTGIILRTFGAPYNETDEITGAVLQEFDEIKMMYFGQQSPNFPGLMLNERVNIESRTKVVDDLDAFTTSYANQKDAEIIVLQGHPVRWNPLIALPRLQAIIDFLRAEGRDFVTPWTYYQRTNVILP
jgi:predicted deacetylase